MTPVALYNGPSHTALERSVFGAVTLGLLSVWSLAAQSDALHAVNSATRCDSAAPIRTFALSRVG